MKQPDVSSVVERRLLVNYRVAPDAVASLLPEPLRPRQIGGWVVAGICLIRLGRVRPSRLPGAFGLRSENAAHRIAVEWDTPDGTRTGVYVSRRDSGSALSVLVGGRLFPGIHHPASFDVRETQRELHVACASRDGAMRVRIDVTVAEKFRGSTLFADLEQASAFFQHDSTGFSAGRDPTWLDGMELNIGSWRVAPVDVQDVRSTFFDDPAQFPPGSAVLDHALLMRDVRATWHPLAPMRVASPPSLAAPVAAGAISRPAELSGQA